MIFEALAQLDDHPDAWSVGAVNAMVSRARGELALACGDNDEAQRLLRRAVDELRQMDSHLEAAIVQLRLASCMARAGDQDEAEIELVAARKAFERAGAHFYLEQCAALQRASDVKPHSEQPRKRP
jgi:tetratricopeptide (TPR) repeat protein